jgi:hypothetical protein
VAVSSFSNSGIKSGSKRNKIWDQSAVENSFFSIATTTATGSTADVTFSDIPQTYTHLQLRMMIKGHTTNTNNTRIQFNSDTATNYSWHYTRGTGSVANSTSGTTESQIYVGNHPSTAVASAFAVYVVDILDYKDTNKYKTTKTLSGYDLNNTDGVVYLLSGNWRSSSAISTIRIFPGADSFGQYSSFALYGIKG